MSDAHGGPGNPGAQALRGCPACGARLPADARFCPSCGRSVEPEPSDERRPVTILFLDIVGSTAIAERLDAEDWKAVVNPALTRFTAIVERHGGRVAQLLGDGLLAFFGAPVAHEDDAVRAVRAGLDLIDAARELGSRSIGNREVRLDVRVGINTGDVVVGAVGGEGRQEYLAVGDAVNVAARLQSVAPAMGILISAETHRLVAAEVEGHPVGPLPLKGKTEPVTGYEVVAIHAVGGHGRRVREGAPLVGRERELAGLTALGERLHAGVGSVAWIVGEPGLGKTRLLLEWRRTLEGPERDLPNVRWVEASCPTIGPELPYHLARECLRTLLGIAGDWDLARMRRRSCRRQRGWPTSRTPSPCLHGCWTCHRRRETRRHSPASMAVPSSAAWCARSERWSRRRRRTDHSSWLRRTSTGSIRRVPRLSPASCRQSRRDH